MPYMYIGFDGIQDVKVLSDLNLNNCSSFGLKFRLALVDNSSEFRIVSNLRATPRACTGPEIEACKKCPLGSCYIYPNGCITPPQCQGHEDQWCVCPLPPTPAPKPCIELKSISDCCKQACSDDINCKSLITYQENLFSPADASAEPSPSPSSGTLCTWNGSSCMALTICPLPKLPTNILGYFRKIDKGSPGNYTDTGSSAWNLVIDFYGFSVPFTELLAYPTGLKPNNPPWPDAPNCLYFWTYGGGVADGFKQSDVIDGIKDYKLLKQRGYSGICYDVELGGTNNHYTSLTGTEPTSFISTLKTLIKAAHSHSLLVMLTPAGNNCSEYQYSAFKKTEWQTLDFMKQFSNLDYDILTPMLYGGTQSTSETNWVTDCGNFSYSNTPTKRTIPGVLDKHLDTDLDNIEKNSSHWGWDRSHGYIIWNDG